MRDAGWGALLDGTLDAIWLVDPKTLCITAVNTAAAHLVGLPASVLVGMPAIALAVTPEDMFFWEDVAAGLAQKIFRDLKNVRAMVLVAFGIIGAEATNAPGY